MKCCRPSCTSDAVLMPRVKVRPVKPEDEVSVRAELPALARRNHALVKQRVMMRVCTPHVLLACCADELCVRYAVEQIAPSDGAVQIVPLSPVMLAAIAELLPSAEPEPKISEPAPLLSGPVELVSDVEGVSLG